MAYAESEEAGGMPLSDINTAALTEGEACGFEATQKRNVSDGGTPRENISGRDVVIEGA